MSIINAGNATVGRTSIQIKVGLLMMVAVILLSAAGYLSYLNLSSIVSSIQVDENPDLRLLRIREISMDLEKAESSIRIYTITSSPGDLQPFYTVISGIDDKIAELREECKNDSVLLGQINTISKLIEENIFIWNQLLFLNRNHNVIEYLNQLSVKLDSVSASDGKADRGILKRVFSRSNKSRLDEQDLINDIYQIGQQDSIMKRKIIARESQLASTSNKIKEQFYDLTEKMENEITGIINARAYDAGRLAGKTYRWLAVFTILGTLLAILVIFIIIRYVRKTNAYQTALENSKAEAEKLSKTRELFMANMSHEIRTPVTAISGFTEQLLHEPFDDKTVRSLKAIKSSSDHLASIINDILDFSKLEDGKVVLEKVPFRIGKILEDIYILFEGEASRKNTRLSYSLDPDIPPVLLGDPYRLKQIMINLVSNSVKFTKEGDIVINVKSSGVQLSEIELVMEFIDTGIGIDEDKLEVIFEDFTQAEMSTTRRYGGTGLGLSIVRKLVELQNGKIECKSRKNEGTRITCIIPFLTGNIDQLKEEPEPPLAIPEIIRNLKILVVDDEEYNRLLFKMIFDRWKVNHQIAANGNEALRMVKAGRYDLLFMDIRMPGIDGEKTAQYIRNEMKINESEMPIVCVTAASVNEDRHRYRKAGMNAFLPKPFTEKMLLNVILSVVKETSNYIVNDTGDGTQETATGTDKINLHHLYRLSGGDEQFVRKMLSTFIDTTKEGLNDMQEAFLSGQRESVSNLAHQLLPPCRHIGAEDLQNLLKKIEESSSEKPGAGEVEELIRESIREFESVTSLLKKFIAKSA